MSALINFSRAQSNRTVHVHPLERLTARFALSHDNHATPIVACYFCLHGVARRPRVLAQAA